MDIFNSEKQHCIHIPVTVSLTLTMNPCEYSVDSRHCTGDTIS